MKSKAPLALMEQLVMVLVFALAAAVCLQVFVVSDRMSRQSEARDRAVLAVQSAAETMKQVRGDGEQAARQLGGAWDGQVWDLAYHEDWTLAEDGGDAVYRVRVTTVDSGQPLLGMAEVTAEHQDGEVLFQVSAAWQEVDEDGET